MCSFECAELLGIDVGPLTFSFCELKTATNDFSPDNKLGEGGFGPVYKVSCYSNHHVPWDSYISISSSSITSFFYTLITFP